MSRKATLKLPASYELPPDFQWGRPSINLLINTVEANFEDFYNKTLKKRVLWKRIAAIMNEEGFDCSAHDCDKKWRNMKKTYVTVLGKQVVGDFTSKFAYFEKMHSVIGKEVDPMGIRDQRLRKAVGGQRTSISKPQPNNVYISLITDGDFHWDNDSVRILLNVLSEMKKRFKSIATNLFRSSTIDSIWEEISSRVNEKGYKSDTNLCQRKWCNLAAGFRHHQAAAEESGIYPMWPFFDQVRDIVNTVNVPISIPEEKQFRSLIASTSLLHSSTTSPKEGSEASKESIEIATLVEDSSISATELKYLMSSISKISKSLDIEKRYSDLQRRLDMLDQIEQANEKKAKLLRNIYESLQNCSNMLEEANPVENAASNSLPQNSIINISDLPPLTFNNLNNAADDENHIIIVDGENEFVLQC